MFSARRRTLFTGKRNMLVCLRLGSALARCRLGGFLRSRIKSHETRGWRYKNQRIRKSCHVTGVSTVLYVEFSQLELQQAHINDIAGNSRDLHTIANSDSALPNQKERAESGKNDVFECE